jgi:AbrB family looped-hinge helix DNA binding protein
MRITMDSAGRLVIPKAIRREAGLQPQMSLEISCSHGRIEIEPAPLPVKLVRKGRLLVAVPQQDREQLTSEIVEKTRRTVRDRRVSSI